jgi:RNA-directed DNA polymerase
MELEDGTRVERTRGPQGGVVSPVLANLFMHYAFDAWMTREHPDLPWCRYADDGLVHCRTEAEAASMKAALAAKFDFLGYCFGQKAAKNRERNEVFVGFGPQVSAASLKAMRQRIRELKLRKRTHVRLTDIAREINPILQGWLNYYGRYTPTAMYPMWKYVNATMVAWARESHVQFCERPGVQILRPTHLFSNDHDPSAAAA